MNDHPKHHFDYACRSFSFLRFIICGTAVLFFSSCVQTKVPEPKRGNKKNDSSQTENEKAKKLDDEEDDSQKLSANQWNGLKTGSNIDMAVEVKTQ